jgi:simple sugar transport system ATP-binding protein
MNREIAVSLKGITKYFPGTIANDHVDLEVRKGEVLALLGENGAGKTTLMKILYGMYQPDAGDILIKGRNVSIRSPHDAMQLGVGMIHQHFTLIPVHNVVENIILGMKPRKGKKLNFDNVAEDIRELGKKYGLEVDPHALIRQLPVGMQQRVEILKALYRQAEVLIMDEPTAVLTPQETERLFSFVREFTSSGNAVIFITHKLNEVMEIADRVTVMRDGKLAGSVQTSEANEEILAEMMVGAELELTTGERKSRSGKALLYVESISVRGDRGNLVLDDLSLEVREGEIFGIAGVSGNGQEELAETICGLRHIEKGAITLGDTDICNRNSLCMIREGIGYIPADRHLEGLVLDMSVEENLILKNPSDHLFSRKGVLDPRKIRKNAKDLIGSFSIKAPSPATRVKALSGGNQQKVVVAREIMIGTRLLVAVQPIRGLDLGASDYVHKMLLEEREKGKAILLISTELSEIMTMSDRIGVIYRGSLLRVFDREEADINEIGLLMAGVTGERNGTDG